MNTHPEDPVTPNATEQTAPVPTEPALEATAIPATAMPSPPTADEPVAPPPALTIEERQALVGRALEAARLPRGLRERLQASLATSEHLTVDIASGEPIVRIGEFAALFEQALPPVWHLDRQTLTRPEHPEGAAFFTGDDEAASDAAAEKIARGQLARSGFLKKEIGDGVPRFSP